MRYAQLTTATFAVVVAMILAAPPPFAAAQGDLESDWRALVALYNATDGDNWTNKTNWSGDSNTSAPTAEELDLWHGVTMTSGRVSWLNLNGNSLTGEIPSELGGLSKLDQLFVNENKLTGMIPPELRVHDAILLRHNALV